MFEENNSNLGDFSLQNQINNYLSYWKWFLLSVLVFLILGYLKLNFTRPQYRASATVQINNNNNSNDSKLAVFQDLGITTNSRNQIEDEIEIIKSKSLIYNVVNDLNLNIHFFTEKNKLSDFWDDTFNGETEYYEKEMYNSPPFNINFFAPDSIINESGGRFLISVISPSEFTYTDKFKKFKASFGDKINTYDFGELIIIPNAPYENNLTGEEILVKIVPVSSIAYSYSKQLNIEPKSDFSSILDVQFTDSNGKRAKDFLKELINQYNNRSISQKESLTKSTSDFVTRRLEIIENQLSDIDLTAESFKTRHGLADMRSQAGINLQSNQEIESRIVAANTELEKIGFIKDFVGSSNSNELIPATFDLGDNSVGSLTQKYNYKSTHKTF